MANVTLRLLLPVILFFAWTQTASAWTWPVEGPVLQPFLYDEGHPYAAGQHRGIDIGANSAGEEVVAPASGSVSFAGTVPTSGACVTIQTSDGYSVTLTHLGSILVAKGTAVIEGAEVGTIGPSGTSEVVEPYVHLGVRVTSDSNGYLDPLTFLPSVAPSVSAGSASPPAPSSAPAAQAPAASQAASAPPTAAASTADQPSGDKAVHARRPTTTRGRQRTNVHSSLSDAAPASSAPKDLSHPSARHGGRVASAAGGRPSLSVPAKPLHERTQVLDAQLEPSAAAGTPLSPPKLERPQLRDPAPQSLSPLLSAALGVGPGLVAGVSALIVVLRRRRRPAAPAGAEGVFVEWSPRCERQWLRAA